jgi:hypothetical protein
VETRQVNGRPYPYVNLHVEELCLCPRPRYYLYEPLPYWDYDYFSPNFDDFGFYDRREYRPFRGR